MLVPPLRTPGGGWGGGVDHETVIVLFPAKCDSHGTDSVQVADLLVRLARAHVMQSQEARDRGGDTGD